MIKKKSIEGIAQYLLRNRIAFQYEEGYLRVKNPEFSAEVFETATYHVSTGELVLMDYDYNGVSYDEFLDRTFVYKNYNK